MFKLSRSRRAGPEKTNNTRYPRLQAYGNNPFTTAAEMTTRSSRRVEAPWPAVSMNHKALARSQAVHTYIPAQRSSLRPYSVTDPQRAAFPEQSTSNQQSASVYVRCRESRERARGLWFTELYHFGADLGFLSRTLWLSATRSHLRWNRSFPLTSGALKASAASLDIVTTSPTQLKMLSSSNIGVASIIYLHHATCRIQRKQLERSPFSQQHSSS